MSVTAARRSTSSPARREAYPVAREAREAREDILWPAPPAADAKHTKESSSNTWLPGLPNMGLPNMQQGLLGTSPRWLRVALIIGLCVPGAGFIIMRDWLNVATPQQFFWRLAHLLVRVLVVHPIGEHIAHRVLHNTMNVQHHQHHLEIKGNHAGADEFEWWCYAVALVAYGTSYTRWFSLALLQYAYFHGLSHDWPELVPIIARHHALHHLAPNKNHCISFSWPDRFLFGTNYTKPPRGLTIPVRVDPMLRGVEPPCFDTERKRRADPASTE